MGRILARVPKRVKKAIHCKATVFSTILRSTELVPNSAERLASLMSCRYCARQQHMAHIGGVRVLFSQLNSPSLVHKASLPECAIVDR